MRTREVERPVCIWCETAIEAAYLEDGEGRCWHEGCLEHAVLRALATRDTPRAAVEEEAVEEEPPEDSVEEAVEEPAIEEAVVIASDEGALKRCSKCGQEKPATEAYFSVLYGQIKNPCRECVGAYVRELRERKRRAILGVSETPGDEARIALEAAALASGGRPEEGLAAEIRRRRQALSLGVGDLAFRASVAREELEAFEWGQRSLSVPEIRRVEVALGTLENGEGDARRAAVGTAAREAQADACVSAGRFEKVA